MQHRAMHLQGAGGAYTWYATRSCQERRKPELPIVSWILSDPPSHVGEMA